MKEEGLRLFIAVPLSPAVEERIGQIQASWRKEAEGVRWVKPENVHITLKFLGHVPKGEVEGIDHVLKEVTKGKQVFPVRIGGAGAFPTKANARVLWIGVEDERGALKEIFEELERRLHDLGFPREERSFKPHLTLGRVKGRRGKRFSFLERDADLEVGVLEVKEVVLFKSNLKPTGAEYTPLVVAPLGG